MKGMKIMKIGLPRALFMRFMFFMFPSVGL